MSIKKHFLIIFNIILILSLLFGQVLSALADGAAPVADSAEFTVDRETEFKSKLSAQDPEDDIVSFYITTPPVKGEINLQHDGNFIYKPNKAKRGRDYFGFKVIDSLGNISQEATVIIRYK